MIPLLVIGMIILLIASLAVGLVMLIVNRRGHPGTAAFVVAGTMLTLLLLLFAGGLFVTPVQTKVIDTPAVEFQTSSADVPLPPGYPTSVNVESSLAPAWRKIVIIGVIAGLLIALAVGAITRGRILLHGHLHLGGAIAVVAVLIGLVILLRLVRQPGPLIVPAPEPPPSISLRSDFGERKIAASPAKGEKRQARSKSSTPVEQSPAEAESPASDSARAETADTKTPAEPAADSRPAWAKVLPHREGDSYVVVVESQSSDPQIREQILDEKMVLEASRYIDDLMFHRSGVSSMVNIDADYLRRSCVRKEYPTDEAVGTESEMFAELVFHKTFRAEVDRRYRQFISIDHVQQLGGFFVAGLAILGGLYAFLRLTPKRTAA